MKKFMIVESPSKCKKIEGFLREIEPDADWSCLATRGHFRVLKRLNKGTEPVYEWDDEKRKHIDMIKKTLEKYKVPPQRIYLATDDDREGEAIAWHFATVADLPLDSTPRITFREITREAIRAALNPANCRHIDMDWVASQQARQVIDRLVGFKVSPFLWKYTHTSSYAPNQKQKYASAGRCQTPALRLLYQHQLQRRASETSPETCCYQTTALFFSNHNQGFEFTLREPKEPKEPKETGEPKEHVEAFYANLMATATTTTYRIVAPPTRPSHTRSVANPLPFQTSTLLQKAHSALQWTTKRTMAAAQDLYQRGIITYHRTESTQYADSFLHLAREYIIQFYGVSFVSTTTPTGNAIKGGHEAIRVTQCKPLTATATDEIGIDATQLYRLIHKNTIESCMCVGSDHVYEIEIDGVDGVGSRPWYLTLSVPKIWGWRAYAAPSAPTQPAADLFFFQSLNPVADIPAPSYIKSIVLLGNRLPYFSEGSLVERLVSLGIGRPSTYSYIIETLQERGYAEVRDVAGEKIKCREYMWSLKAGLNVTEKERSSGAEKKKMTITPFGEKVVEFLCGYDGNNKNNDNNHEKPSSSFSFSHLFSYDYTSHMEAALDEIANASNTFLAVCDNCLSQIRKGERAMNARFAPRPVGDDGWEVCWRGGDTFLRRLRRPIPPRTNKNTNNTIVVYDKDVKNDHKNNKNNENPEETTEEKEESEKKDPYEYVLVAPGLVIDQDTPAPADVREWMMRSELGENDGDPVLLKKGPFGLYVEYRGQTKSLDKTPWDYQTIDLEKAVSLFSDAAASEKNQKEETEIRERPNPNILRVLSPSLSIRRNKKTGYAYVFYQTPTMGAPKFFPFRGAPVPYQSPDKDRLVDWIQETYGVLA